MCEQCFNSVVRYFPGLPESDMGELLMSATSFPFGSPDHIEKQLKELAENTDGTLQGRSHLPMKG